MHQRAPLAGTALVEDRDVQRALVEQRTIRVGTPRVEALAGDVLVEVLEALVVAHVDDDPPVAGERAGRSLVAEAAERRALAAWCTRIARVELDDPAEAQSLVRLAAHVEARLDVLPAVVAGLQQREAPMRRGRARIGAAGVQPAAIAAEVVVDVLLGREVGTPRRLAAGAVAKGAEHAPAVGIRRGAQQCVAGRGPFDLQWRRAGHASRVRRTALNPPLAAREAQLDDRDAVRGEFERRGLRVASLPIGECPGIVTAARPATGEHQLRVRIFVVHAEQAALACRVERKERERVAVVAELARLPLGGAGLEQASALKAARVDARHVGPQRIAPAQQHARAIARRHAHACRHDCRRCP